MFLELETHKNHLHCGDCVWRRTIAFHSFWVVMTCKVLDYFLEILAQSSWFGSSVNVKPWGKSNWELSKWWNICDLVNRISFNTRVQCLCIENSDKHNSQLINIRGWEWLACPCVCGVTGELCEFVSLLPLLHRLWGLSPGHQVCGTISQAPSKCILCITEGIHFQKVISCLIIICRITSFAI